MIALFISNKSCEKLQEHQRCYELLRQIIGESYGDFNSLSELKNTEHNKPYIDGIVFSLSHSNGICSIAMDVVEKTYNIEDVNVIKIADDIPTSLGVDIECISDKNIEKCRRIAEKKFFNSECELLNKSSCDNEYVEKFCVMWTKKESYCKFTGIGIADALGFDTTASNNEVNFYNKIMTIDNKRFSVSVCYNSDTEI